MAIVLLPLTQMHLGAEYCTRMEHSDACESGIGRAWTLYPADTVARIAVLADGRGAYTNLDLPDGISLEGPQACALKRLEWPTLPRQWRTVAAPCRRSHIGLAEADAAIWSLEDRMRRPREWGCRVIHGVDAAALVGAFCKGRSSSRLFNRRCRRRAAISLVAGFEEFFVWIESARNEADAPSRLFELASLRQPQRAQPVAPPVAVEVRHSWQLQGSAASAAVFVHLCAGPRAPDDFSSQIVTFATDVGFAVRVWRIDPAYHGPASVLSAVFQTEFLSCCFGPPPRRPRYAAGIPQSARVFKHRHLSGALVCRRLIA